MPPGLVMQLSVISAPLLNPNTLKPMTAKELSVVFCDELVAQELNNDTAYLDIPHEILNFYKPILVRLDGEGVTEAP